MDKSKVVSAGKTECKCGRNLFSATECKGGECATCYYTRTGENMQKPFLIRNK